jgi:hypothetical protein
MRTALVVLASLAMAMPVRAQQLPLKGYGQELVDQVLAKERGLLVVVMHVSPPGMANYPIVASNIGRIGKVADDDDMRVVTTGKTNLEVAHGGTRFEVEMPMRDLAGNTIGALGIVFPYSEGASRPALEKRAVSIRDWLARRILDAGSLTEPYPFEPLATTRTYAQKLVEATLTRHAEIDLLAMRAKPAKGRDYSIVASSFGRIGMKVDEPASDRPSAGARSGGKRYEVELPLLDTNGGAVGALTVGWPLRTGDDEKAFVSRAETIRDELRPRIPALDKLVELDP